jgi:lysophospholipase L1-like esterase
MPKKDDVMNPKKLLTQVIVCSFVSLLLVACGIPQPEPTSTATLIPESTVPPTMIPTDVATEWLYVALGDSEATCCGIRTYPKYYADFIEQDLNVEVNLRNLGASGMTSEELLDKLDTENYRNLISKAQIVTIVITMNDLLLCPQGDRECAEEKLAMARTNYTAIIEEILKLTSTEVAVIRTQTYDNPFVNKWKERGVFDEQKPMFDRWNQQIVEIATQYDIPVAEVYRDFNGPNGDQDPGEKGYISSDGMHNNDAGARRMAELLRELGYTPLEP